MVITYDGDADVMGCVVNGKPRRHGNGLEWRLFTAIINLPDDKFVAEARIVLKAIARNIWVSIGAVIYPIAISLHEGSADLDLIIGPGVVAEGDARFGAGRVGKAAIVETPGAPQSSHIVHIVKAARKEKICLSSRRDGVIMAGTSENRQRRPLQPDIDAIAGAGRLLGKQAGAGEIGEAGAGCVLLQRIGRFRLFRLIAKRKTCLGPGPSQISSHHWSGDGKQGGNHSYDHDHLDQGESPVVLLHLPIQ